MRIGTATRNQDGSYTLHIHTLTVSLELLMKTNPGKTKPKAPDYRIQTYTHIEGQTLDVGAAWSKTSDAGRPYIQFRLEDPFLQRPVFGNLVDEADELVAYWSKPNKAPAND
jgi:uncharacterized protein (DUF736 family)